MTETLKENWYRRLIGGSMAWQLWDNKAPGRVGTVVGLMKIQLREILYGAHPRGLMIDRIFRRLRGESSTRQ